MYIPLLKGLDFYVSWTLNQFAQVQFNVQQKHWLTIKV